jgi:hypothetical protein
VVTIALTFELITHLDLNDVTLVGFQGAVEKSPAISAPTRPAA